MGNGRRRHRPRNDCPKRTTSRSHNIPTACRQPFKIDYDSTSILTCDDWKHKVGGISQGCFLLAFYENDFGVDEEQNEILLLRALHPCPIPSDNSVISSRIEYFKEELKTAGNHRQIDQFTRFGV